MLQRELLSYLRTGYPFLALRSHEEERVQALLRVLAKEIGAQLVTLSVAAQHPLTGQAAARAVIEAMAGHDAPALFALVDLAAQLGDAGVARALRELSAGLERRRQTAVLIAPTLTLPAALESDVVSFEVPLPTPIELAALLRGEAQRAGVEIAPETAARAVRGVQGLTLSATSRAFRRALAPGGALRTGEIGELVREKRRILRQTDVLEFIDAPPSLADIGGLALLKEWLVEREAAFDVRAREFGLPTPKGLLLAGVQGCGKSLTAKAVAQLWNLPLARLEFGALFTHRRTPEENLRRVLKLADALAPVVLWVDEIDKAFSAVGQTGSSASVARVFASLVTWLQEKQTAVFVVATANQVEHLPAELLRKGRFDEIFFVDLPAVGEREQILTIHLAAHGRDPARYDVAGLAKGCEHFGGAELRQVVVDGLYRAFQRGRELTDDDLAVVARQTVPLYRMAEDQIKALREWANERARRASPDARLKDLWTGATEGRGQ